VKPGNLSWNKVLIPEDEMIFLIASGRSIALGFFCCEKEVRYEQKTIYIRVGNRRASRQNL
jgi:hypothetical protein